MADKLISKIPDGPLAEKWTKRKSELRLVNPNNRRKLEIIVGSRRTHGRKEHPGRRTGR